MNNIFTGNVIYWNRSSGYGFIKCNEFPDNIFFHKSKLTYEKTQLFDYVSFQSSISNYGKHKGEKIAIEINLIERGNLKDYKLYIGIIKDWNGSNGFIDYPTDGKEIRIYLTRLLKSKSLQNGDLVIFNPIKSSINDKELFAFFAYPITFENDIRFIKAQYENHPIPALKRYFLNSSNNNKLSPSEKFELELMSLGEITTNEDYLSLLDLLKKYYRHVSFSAKFDLLSQYVSTTYLIQLWESGIIQSYDIEIIKEYFIGANADTKRTVIQKLTEPDKSEVIINYYHHLQKSNKLDYINNDLKTFLDIIYRNKKTRTDAIYKDVKKHLIESLSYLELIDLWLHKYIDGIKKSIIIKNFNIADKKAIEILTRGKDKAEHADLISKIYEQYFISIANGSLDFEEEYPNLANYLKTFKGEYNERYAEIINILKKTLNEYQQFVLWILGVNIDFYAYYYIVKNIKEINHFFRLKFTLRRLKENKDTDIQKLIKTIHVDEAGLKDFAVNYKWNEAIYPTIIKEKEENHSFLKDVVSYNLKCNKNFDVSYLADAIYNSTEKYSEIHIRLWLYDYLTDNKYFNYLGFREWFKKLTDDEQKYFISKTEETFDNIIEQKAWDIKPCTNFKQSNQITRVYNAFVENIYFGNNYIKLRLENRGYTKNKYTQEFSSTALNRIPTNHYLNKTPLKISVVSKKIVDTLGFQRLFTLIHTDEIEKALEGVIEFDERKEQNYTHEVDRQLRKEVIGYLNENQVSNIETTIVNEAKRNYRRLDDQERCNDFEKTALFTIEVENKNEYAIVWENIDLSEDRATYIFKCLKENHNIQLQKITDAIKSLAQFRSTLSSSKDVNELTIFKNNLGFITSIRKQRGQNMSFYHWLKKFEEALMQQIPELSTTKELQKIENWTSNTPHTPSINKSPKRGYNLSTIIREKDLNTTDIHLGQNQNDNGEQIRRTNNGHNDSLHSLLNALTTFNQYFTENLKI